MWYNNYLHVSRTWWLH